MKIPTLIYTDGYKTLHRVQYPENTTLVYSNWTPRRNNYGIPNLKHVVHFGLQ